MQAYDAGESIGLHDDKLLLKRGKKLKKNHERILKVKGIQTNKWFRPTWIPILK